MGFGEWMRITDLYAEAKKDIEGIDGFVDFLDEYIQEGSLFHMFDFKRMQTKFTMEIGLLSSLADKPSLGSVPNPTMEEAVGRVREMKGEYEDALRSLMEILEYGLEKYIEENLDMKNRYYVPVEARDRLLDAYIEKKPETLDEMKSLAHVDLGYRYTESAWSEAYGNNFGLYFLREQVGFDKAQFNVDIVSMNMGRFMDAVESHKQMGYSILPRIVVECVEDPDDEEDPPMVLPVEGHRYKRIEITLSHHVSFLFQRNNSPIQDDGRRKSDIYLLRTTVEPQPGYEFLGNIRSYNYGEMGEVIRKAIDDLYELTGIRLDHDSVRLNDVELNLTFRQGCQFDQLMRSVSYYQNFIRKGYVTKEFKASAEDIVPFIDMSDCDTEDQYKKKARKAGRKFSRMKTTGFVTSADSLQIKLYDKKEETMNYAASQGYELKIEGDDAIVRLEFRIRKRDQLKRYFYTGDDPVYFKDLSQETIENTYKELAGIFFRDSYENGYVPESTEALKGIVSSLDTSGKKGKWKHELVGAVLSQEIWQKSTPALLTEKDIAGVLQYNKTFARKPSQYKKILLELLQESDLYKKGQEHAYDMLFNFLNKVCELNTLMQRRRIGFAVSEQFSSLPRVKDARIGEILNRRWQYCILPDMGRWHKDKE